MKRTTKILMVMRVLFGFNSYIRNLIPDSHYRNLKSYCPINVPGSESPAKLRGLFYLL